MIELGGVDFALKYVIGSPGFQDRRPIYEFVDDAHQMGLARNFPHYIPKSLMPSMSEIHFEIFASGRLVVVRAMASDDLSLDSEDTGHIMRNFTAFYAMPDRRARYFLLQLNPAITEEIWLPPRIDDGMYSIRYDGWQHKAPVSDLVDELYAVLLDIVDRKRWRDYCCQASQARINLMYQRHILGSETDIRHIKVPRMTRGRWFPDMIDYANDVANNTLRRFCT